MQENPGGIGNHVYKYKRLGEFYKTKAIELVKRIFGRRGRNNWDEKTRAKEKSRLSERRLSERWAK